MDTFKDNTGHEWELPEFTLGLLTRVKKKTGVDFLDDSAAEPDAKTGKSASKDAGRWIVQLYNPFHLGAVLYTLLEEPIKAKGLDTDSFAELCSGPVLDTARNAIVSSLVSFSHSPSVAAAIRSELPQIQAKLTAALIAQWKKRVGGSLESLASTPAASV